MASTNASTRARASRATSRGTVRDSARQCGTVFEDGKGRSSSRRAGKKMPIYHDLLFYYSFYCGFESPRVVTVAALKLTVSFLHNVTMTSILGRVRGFRPTRASILRSARALSR